MLKRLPIVNRFIHISLMAVVTPTDHPKSVPNRCVIQLLMAFLCCDVALDFSVGVGAFVIGLSQISFFFSSSRKPLNGIQRNLTGSKVSTSSTILCFYGRSSNLDGSAGLSDLDIFRILLWNCWMEFNENWQEARSFKISSTRFVFSDRSGN